MEIVSLTYMVIIALPNFRQMVCLVLLTDELTFARSFIRLFFRTGVQPALDPSTETNAPAQGVNGNW